MAPTILRLGIFALLAAIIVLMFPRYNNAFRYYYEVGKPWGAATLTADFDFPIYKTDEQLEKEQQQLLSTFTPCYRYIRGVQRQLLVASLQDIDRLQAQSFSRSSIMHARVAHT